MTWSAFMDLVIEELGSDGTRRGIETLRTRAARDAVVDLQRYIRAYRQGHTTRYDEADLTVKGYAHLGTLPSQAKPKAFYVVSLVPVVSTGDLPDPNTERNRLDYVAWEDRLDRLIRARYDSDQYLYAVSPFSRQFLVHPLINDETYLLMVWDGLKMNFGDTDEVPFPEQAAAAVAAYVKWRILLEFDRRIDLAREQYDVARKTGIYATLRLGLYREQQESQMASGRDEEYDGDVVPPPTNVGEFDAQSIPLLRTITAISGSGANALEQISTVSLTVPTSVMLIIGGVMQIWTLDAGTTATAPGVQRPSDWDGTTNAKVWVLSA